ncbi:MAG: L-threonylcarbamoyladenylate synthase [Cyanobacteria bacterium P01_A01_bin.114]
MPSLSLPEFIAAACSGEAVVSFPTDTVPAVACRPAASELIYQLKRRDRTKPLILMGADADDLWPYASGQADDWPMWQAVADRYWPGQLTLVLPASDRVPPAVNQADINPKTPCTIGLRVPNQPIARYLLGFTGPLATTSANLSGQPPLQTLTEIADQFPEVAVPSEEALEQIKTEALAQLPPTAVWADLDRVQISGRPSTVAKWTAHGWEIIRQGAVRLEVMGSG